MPDGEKKNPLRRLRGRLRAAWAAVRPGTEAWRGAAWGTAALYLVLVAAFALGQGAVGTWGLITFAGLLLFGAVLALLSGLLADLARGLLALVPRLYWIVLAGLLVMLSQMLFHGIGPVGLALLIAAVLLPGSLLGAAAWTLARGRWPALTRWQRAVTLAGLAAGLVLLGGGLAWYLWPGPQVAAPPVALDGPPAVDAPPADDPSAPGPYAVRTLTYGSRDDRRPEFGTEADLSTQPVDGSALVENWSGITGRLRSAYWGFDATALPLNGRVWYPEGEGPFPLALIVHGNHSMFEHSDPGYAYLGELLASRGIILASVDENFLNSGWTDWVLFGVPEELKEENDARGWLLLEHLAQWRRWHETPGNPFYGKVDLERVALMGHSRGGEAAAIAAAFNRLPAYPGDARRAFDYNFGIRGVVAIAPSDGQYKPAGRGTPLHNVHYLAIQGAYDGDVRAFMGIRQYNRVELDEPGLFKAAVYVAGANHGQFNTVWGRSDSEGFPGRGLLNLAPLMPQAEQMQIGRVLISAFLEATLHDRQEYRPLFRDLRAARAWLPATAYVTRYAESGTRILAGFEEDVDPTTATLAGATLAGENLARWQETVAAQKWDDQQTSAVTLGWETSEQRVPRYSLALPAGGLQAGPDGLLVLGLAAGEVYSRPLDLTLELVDGSGQVARLPLSHFAPLQPQVEFHTLKHRLLEPSGYRPAEPVFQTYEFALAAWQASNPVLDLANLAQVRLVFDRSPKGLILLDDLGLREGAD